MNRNPSTRAALLLLLFIPGWELFRVLAEVSPVLMPPLVDIGRALVEGVWTGRLVSQTLYSLGLILLGGFIALLLALGAIFLALRSDVARKVVDHLGSIFHPLPGIALLPLIILWFGIGPSAILAVIVHSVLWPLVTNLQSGIRSVPEVWRMSAANYGVRGWRYLWLVLLPASAPAAMAGMRIAWARAWRALLSAEMLFGAAGAGGGLGWFIATRRSFMDTPGLFAGIIVISAIGVGVENYLFRTIETRTLVRWGMAS